MNTNDYLAGRRSTSSPRYPIDSSAAKISASGPDKEVRIARDEIEEIGRSKVSVMPAGLDKQLTLQQLADLVEFLKTRK